MKPRQLVLAAALLGSAWLAWFGDKTPVDQAEVVEAVTRVRPPGMAAAGGARPPAAGAETGSASGGPVTVLRLRERAPDSPQGRSAEGQEGRLFGAGSWDPPPPKVDPGPPPPPTAPPLPYTYLGKKREDGVWEVYLAVGEDTRVVRAQSVLDGKYRIDAIRPPTLSLTYLPLQQAQTLNIGTAE